MKNYSIYRLEHFHHLEIVPAPKIDQTLFVSIFVGGIQAKGYKSFVHLIVEIILKLNEN